MLTGWLLTHSRNVTWSRSHLLWSTSAGEWTESMAQQLYSVSSWTKCQSIPLDHLPLVKYRSSSITNVTTIDRI